MAATAASLQGVSASYWTVRAFNQPAEYRWYWAEYEQYSANATSSVSTGYYTSLTCSFSRGDKDASTLFTDDGKSYGGCTGTESVSSCGTSSQLQYLKVLNSAKIYNCIVMETSSDYQSYVCGTAILSAIPPNTTTTAMTTTAAPPPANASDATTTSAKPTTTAALTCSA